MDRIYIKHFFQSQQYETRNQLQKEKHMDTKQHATKKPMVNEEIKEQIRKYLETNKNGTTTLQNLWDAPKAVLRGKFIEIWAFLKNKKNVK